MLQETNKDEEPVSKCTTKNINLSPSLSDVKPVDRELEKLILQWITLTREELEIDEQEEVDENK